MFEQHNNADAARAIGVSEAIYNGLLEVRRQLLSDELHYVPDPHKEPIGACFNMDLWSYRGDCGSVHCIGGAVQDIIGEEELGEAMDRILGLNELFYPDIANPEDAYPRITAAQAAQAILNFLTIGNALWKTVLGAA